MQVGVRYAPSDRLGLPVLLYHYSRMDHDVRIERTMNVLQTFDLPLVESWLKLEENRRIERRHPFQGVSVFKTVAHH